MAAVIDGARPRRWPRARRGARSAGLALLLLLVAGALTPTGRYLLRAAWEEGRILANRRSITEMVADSRTDGATRAKLRIVLDARRFAADSVGLTTGESFTRFTQLERDTLVLVLSAAQRDRLVAHGWWFPIVGRVPYKGFFDFGAARQTARDMEADGYDSYLRPASAFSTLGWFNDPLLSTSLREDTLDLANTVIHELTHNTFYAPGQAPFNESFANFVGARGAVLFFEARGQLGAAAEVERRWTDEQRLGAYWARVYASLDSAFTAHAADRAARLRARDTVFARARRTLVDSVMPALKTVAPGYGARVRLDNASLLARRIYLTDLTLFERVFAREGRDLRRTIARVTAIARRAPDAPFDGVQRWLVQHEAESRRARDVARRRP